MFEISDELSILLEQIRTFVRAHIFPLEKRLSNGGLEAHGDELQALRADVKARGWWGPQIPSQHGGMGLSMLEHARVSEVLGASPLGHYVFGCQAPDAGNLEILSELGTAEQKARWLAPLAAGEIRSCFSMTEPGNAGSNPINLSTTAVLDNGEWVINGHKWFTSSADGAAFAIVMTVTDPEGGKYQRASMIIVPLDTPGLKLVRNIPVMGHAGSGYFSHAELTYTDVRVPEANLLGGRGMGFMIAQQRLGPGRIHHCMRWIGVAERSLELMCRRALARDLGGGKPLATRQTVQIWIAESRAEIDAARLMVLNAAHRIDAVGSRAARVEISSIKFFVANVMVDVIDRAIQVHGALGVTEDTPLSHFYRHERSARIYDGPDEVHKLVVARQVLKSFPTK